MENSRQPADNLVFTIQLECREAQFQISASFLNFSANKLISLEMRQRVVYNRTEVVNHYRGV
jgi:hypothetical protein